MVYDAAMIARRLALLGVTLALACHQPPPGKVEIVAAPSDGDVAAQVRSELQRAQRENRQLLVYVGATWCDPCRRFHAAAAAGQLDATFPRLRLLEFDSDRDNERLASANYVSQFIPLFALPGPDGRGSGRQVEGSAKGGDAVGGMVPRLSALLAPAR
jgi:hypothetical protein